MKYGQLVAFEPIESIVQVRQADGQDKARQLVESFVVSDRMAELVVEVALPNLQWHTPADCKSLLVVGSYGTGKSHLMALLSALAEHGELAEAVRNRQVIHAAASIAGRFKVIRTELGATRMSLRDILCGELEERLSDWSIRFSFPPAESARNNKDSLLRMMDAFQQVYPDHGLLLLVDELLDYLRSRSDQELAMDLGFLRELGEVASSSRLRFLAGLQASLFDSPRFHAVADSVQRIKDRFQQLRIVKEDVAHVVAERLLAKSSSQKDWIRKHLQRFTPLYDAMAERLEEFVRLFPIHPAYLECFERIEAAEKREILKTISAEIRSRLDEDVPPDEPGLISYDSYWKRLRDDAIIRAVPEVREVIDKSSHLERRLDTALASSPYRAMALRIAHGLSIHRLTTGDIHAPIGPTAGQLRDDLCLHHPLLPEQSSDFLRSTVESCLAQMIRATSGQFITHNRESDQYYLDLDRDVDYEAQIEKRAANVALGELDTYYFDLLERVLQCPRQTCAAGYRVWTYHLPWPPHKTTRTGYLFFGAPNQCSTALPPRDFYLYFLQPFEPPDFDDAKGANDLFFRLSGRDATFDRLLRLYAGARMLASEAASTTRKAYQDKAEVYEASLCEWFERHGLLALEVCHQGKSKAIGKFAKGRKLTSSRGSAASVRQWIDRVAAEALGPVFDARYPQYPKFAEMVATPQLHDAAAEAIEYLAGGAPTRRATIVLGALELLDDGELRPEKSRYAGHVLQRLHARPLEQVLNRAEFMTPRPTGEELEADFQLEPELVVLVLMALVYSGQIDVVLPGGRRIEAANIGDRREIDLAELRQFQHIARPKGIPLPPLIRLFQMLGLDTELVRSPESRLEGLRQMHHAASHLVQRLVIARQQSQGGLRFWGLEWLSTGWQRERSEQLCGLQEFLQGLQVFDSPDKLRGFTATVDEIDRYASSLKMLDELEAAVALAKEAGPIAAYLAAAAAILSAEDPWRRELRNLQAEWRTRFLEAASPNITELRDELPLAINRFKNSYAEHYQALHRAARLTADEDRRRRDLLGDRRLERLQQLAKLPLLPAAMIDALRGRLERMVACEELTSDELAVEPICPHCGYVPQQDQESMPADAALQSADEQLDDLTRLWTRALLEALDDPTVRQRMSLLDDSQRSAVERFVSSQALPDAIPPELIDGLRRVLAGLAPLTIHASALVRSLSDSDLPCTIDEFRLRFDDFVHEVLGGHDRRNVRIVFQRGS